MKRTVATEVPQRSGLSNLTCNFVALVAGRGRTDHIEAIAEKYRKLLDENLGRVRASVRTTVSLTDEERRMLSAKIGQVRRSQEVVLEEIVDPTMLGGFLLVIRVTTSPTAARAQARASMLVVRTPHFLSRCWTNVQ